MTSLEAALQYNQVGCTEFVYNGCSGRHPQGVLPLVILAGDWSCCADQETDSPCTWNVAHNS